MYNKIRTCLCNIATFMIFIHAIPTMGMTGIMYEYNKMASSLLHNACQDNYGFIWVATDFGLSRFDGYHFVNFYHISKDSTSISSNIITTLTYTSAGNLLIGSAKGLMQYDYTTNQFYNYHFPKDIHPRINSITESSSQRLWVSTAGHGMYVVDQRYKTVHHAKAIERVIGNRYMNILFMERNGYIWITTSNGKLLRCKINGETPKNITLIGSKGEIPLYITEETKGNLLLFYAKKILRFHTSTGQLSTANILLPQELEISSVYQAPNGTFYIGSIAQGLYTIKKGSHIAQKETLYDSHYMLQDITINSIFLDKNNNLWMTSPRHGLYFCPTNKQQFTSWNFIYQGERLSDGITSIAPTDDGGILSVMKNNGLFKVDKQGNVQKYKNAPSGSNAIFRDSQNRFWLGTWNGLYLFNPQTGASVLVNTFYEKGAKPIAEDKKGQLYVSLFGYGFIILDSKGKPIRHYNTHIRPKKKGAKFGNDWVEHIYCDHQGLVWIATTSGFWCYDPQYDYFVDNGSGDGIMRETNILSICEMPNQQLMIGTQNGLYTYAKNSGKISQLPGSEALEDMRISNLEQDQDGNIWISTPKGIWQYACNEGKLVNYAGSNGIAEEEFFGGSAFHQGVMYFGANSTITLFRPNDLKGKEKTNEQIYITRAASVSKTYNPFSPKFVIPWDDNHFTLEFSLLDYKNTNVTFEYRMNDGKWTIFENEINRLTFTKLNSGTYKLEIRALRGGKCISSIKRITIIVKAPWYASTAAKMTYTIAGLLLLYILALYFYRRQKANFEEEKMKLLINATHDIRSPLTLILGPIDKLKNLVKNNCDEEVRNVIDQYINTIDRNVERLLLLVNQILDMRKIDKQQMKIKCRETDMVDFVKKACLSFDFVAEQRGISLKVERSEEKMTAWIDRINFDKVLTNILANAFKYTLEGGEVVVRICHDDLHLIIKVIDSGIGFGNEKTTKLFERFYQGNTSTGIVGTGIGLNLAMNIVKLHGGTISASNRTDGKQGACITIILPLGNSHLRPDNLYIENKDEQVSPKTIYKKGRIMMVDDDCELLAYTTQELAPWYHINGYSNGIDAMQALLTQDYDLVVSDVMMSGMDGITLLKKIKQNPKTNHIPVILLTSKSEVSDRLEGFKYGADAYLVKPFNIEELHTRIDSLIDTMRRLKGKFSGTQQQLDKVEQVEVKGNDEQLMKRVMKSVNAHISDGDFTVDTLATEVGLSRVQLHRKMKELTGISTGKFIRNIRMEQARRLIAEGKQNITQIAYEIGFNDPTYFSTVFKQYFGKTPSEYIKDTDSE